MQFSEALDAGSETQPQAWAIFDALPPATIEQMTGSWAGAAFPTGHPMDGALEATGWQGKRFDDAERGHPLIFHADDDAGGTFAVDPARYMGAGRKGRASAHRADIETDQPKSRLRMIEHRGTVSAAMVYDELAIIDHFRSVDADTLMGVMDMRGLPLPYFFVLRRGLARDRL